MEPTSRFIYLQQTINGLRYKLSLADESNYKLEKSLENEKQRNVILKDLNNDFAVRYKAIVKDNEQLNEMNEELKCQNQSLIDKIKSLNLELEDNARNLEISEQKSITLEADLEAKAIECENCMKELQYQKNSTTIYKTLNQEYIEELAEMKSNICYQDSLINQMEDEINNLTNANQNLNENNRLLVQKNDELNSRLLHHQSLINIKTDSTENIIRNEESLSDDTSVSSDEIMMKSITEIVPIKQIEKKDSVPRLSLDSGFNSDENELHEEIYCKVIDFEEQTTETKTYGFDFQFQINREPISYIMKNFLFILVIFAILMISIVVVVILLFLPPECVFETIYHGIQMNHNPFSDLRAF